MLFVNHVLVVDVIKINLGNQAVKIAQRESIKLIRMVMPV
jgi:hypothetical protein